MPVPELPSPAEVQTLLHHQTRRRNPADGYYLINREENIAALTRLQQGYPSLRDRAICRSLARRLRLYGAGFTTFKSLADVAPERLTSVIELAGFKAPFDPSSWPRQAGLAARGEWAALEALQDELTGGRGG